MIGRDVGRHFSARPQDFFLPEIRHNFDQNDFVLANLETPVSERGRPYPKQDPHVAFCANPESLQIIRGLGVSAVTLANNHMLDYGPVALADTLGHLDDNGILHFGAGTNYSNANAPLLTNINGLPVAFLGTVFIFSSSTERAGRNRPGVADYALRPLLRQIRHLKENGYIVIVTIHWGLEYSFYPLQYQASQARQMIDCGASLILGHGPHYPQGVERYKHGEIVYSLGNFIFDEPFRYSNRSFIYSAEVTSDGVKESSVAPVIIDNHVPRLAKNREKKKLSRMIYSLNKIYERKSRRFWQDHNNLHFRSVFQRVVRNRDLKFFRLQPITFYGQLGAHKLS
jgi:poly-gamma-glutamate capsule biosynthesis protein CapA/YwtB (metallophosphatase superfamily)